MKALTINGLTKDFGKVRALNQLSAEINVGEAVGLIGCNGAGKSTLIRMITAQISPSAGRIEVLGMHVNGEALEVKRVIGYVPDEDVVVGKLTPMEYLGFMGSLRRVPDLHRRITEVLRFFDMSRWSGCMMETFSRGMKKRIQFAAAILHGPRLLVMDEPMSGFDPEMMAVIRSLVRSLLATGTTILMSTHDLPVAAETCNRFLVLDRGVLKAAGSAPELMAETHTHSLTDAYLRLVNAPDREEEASALVAHLTNRPENMAE